MDKNAKPLTAEQIAEKIAKQTELKNAYYPDATLNEKQLATLHSVIGSENDRKENQTSENNDDPAQEKKSGKRVAKRRKNDQEIKGGSPVKTVLWVIFVLILIGGAGFAGLYYWWTNHATFDYALQPVVILEGQNIQADDFLTPGENADGVHAHLQDPDFQPSTEFYFVNVHGLRQRFRRG